MTEAEFWTRVTKAPDGCWYFHGADTGTGYGLFSYGGCRHWLAHRLAYTLQVGPIPPGMCVMHACDNRRCVNPAHLRVGTIADNNWDMARKGRHVGRRGKRKAHCIRGHPMVGDNLVRSAPGRFACKACQKIRYLRWKERRRPAGTPRARRWDAGQLHTHCRRGHPLTGDNVATNGRARICRTCRNTRQRERWRTLQAKSL